MSRARLRPATLADLDLLVRHRRAMFAEMERSDEARLDAHDRLYRRWARTRLRSGALVAFVVEAGREAAASGAVWIQPIQPLPHVLALEQPYLLSMYTEPAHRGRGHATRIVRAAVAWAKKRGFARISLHATDAGRPVYARLGFTDTTEMRLALSSTRRAPPRGTPRRRRSSR